MLYTSPSEPDGGTPARSPAAADAVLTTLKQTTFDLTLRGYRPDQVHAVLDHVRAEVLELLTALGHARREAEAARLRARQLEEQVHDGAVGEDDAAEQAPVSEAVADLVERASEVVREQFRGSSERADAIVRAAEQVAVQVTADARADADGLLQRAREEAADVAAQAELDRRDADAVQASLHATLRSAFDAVASLRESLGPVAGPGRAHDLASAVGPVGDGEGPDAADGADRPRVPGRRRERPWSAGEHLVDLTETEATEPSVEPGG